MTQPTPVTAPTPVVADPARYGLNAVLKDTTNNKLYVVTGLPDSNMMVQTKEVAYMYREFDPDRGPVGKNLIRSQKSMEGGRFVTPG